MAKKSRQFKILGDLSTKQGKRGVGCDRLKQPLENGLNLGCACKFHEDRQKA